MLLYLSKEKGRKWFKSGIDETEIEKRPSKPRRVVVFVKRLRIIEKKIHDGSNSNRSRDTMISMRDSSSSLKDFSMDRKYKKNIYSVNVVEKT
jgi:hypothetical protein